jgi:transcription termination factor Rho
MHLKELKKRAPAELVEMAEANVNEAPTTMPRQDLIFPNQKQYADDG